MLTGKIHMARITACELDYEGSLEIDPEILAEAGILPYEKILVVNRNNGERLETYAIPGAAGPVLTALPYDRIPTPLYPFAPITETDVTPARRYR